MKLCINDMLYSFSYALDCVEHDLIGVTTYHGLRVAAISIAMGKQLGISENELLDLACCAVLHDNALTEYIQAERENDNDVVNRPETINLASHCSIGERNLRFFPFQTDVASTILYHHENADGTGPFRKKASETPIKAQLIHLADQLDSHHDLSFCPDKKYSAILQFLSQEEDHMFSKECVELFKQGCPESFLPLLHQERALVTLKESLPVFYKEYPQKEIIGICSLMAKIVDYKSEFTRKHSVGIAEKSMAMGKFYHYDEETLTKLYFAGALHDIGKLIVNRDILEKPARLTDVEYRHIQNHAYRTYEILSHIDGLGEVVNWASFHHERLDGKGYPFGKTASELGKMERLLACLDIYQALTEERPYKKGMSHEHVMEILREMASKNQIDKTIVEDINMAYQNGYFIS